MGTQTVVGGLQFTVDGDKDIGDYLEEVITDASEDELHSAAAADTSIGTRHAGRMLTHAWVGFETGGRYANLKRTTGKDRRIPLPCGVLGSTNFKGLVRLKTAIKIESGDIIAVWTEP